MWTTTEALAKQALHSSGAILLLANLYKENILKIVVL